MASKKEWGNICWFLFHTLAYKLNNDAHIGKLLEQILSICNNLPCEDCASHATSILNTVNVELNSSRPPFTAALSPDSSMAIMQWFRDKLS